MDYSRPNIIILDKLSKRSDTDHHKLEDFINSTGAYMYAFGVFVILDKKTMCKTCTL